MSHGKSAEHGCEIAGRSAQAGLDPVDWCEIRRLGHRMVDDVLNALENVHEAPVWRPVPETVRERLREGLPREPQGSAAVYEDYLRDVAPYPRGNTHPRFWGWVNGSGVPMGMFADFLASAMNSSVGAFECAPTMVEEQVISWLKEMLDVNRLPILTPDRRPKLTPLVT